MEGPLDAFGRVTMESFRDRGIAFYDKLALARWKAPFLAELQGQLQSLTEEQRVIVRRCVIATLDDALHDFLFRLQEDHEDIARIEVCVNGTSVIPLSDGLHGEPYGPEGWRARFSKYDSPDAP